MKMFLIDQTMLKNLIAATESIRRSQDLVAQDMPVLATQVAALQGAVAARLIELNKPEKDDKDRLLDVEEAAEMLGVNSFWIYKRSKELPFVLRVGQRKLRISERELRDYIREQIENGVSHGA